MNDAQARLGSRLDGKYDLTSIVAAGPGSVLFEATHTWTGRRVTVKMLREQIDGDERRSRFKLEARTAAALRHPNVVDVLDMGSDEGGQLYLVLEFLEGISLDTLLAENQRLSTRDALEVLLPVMGAMAIAHDAGIVHRDLKPGNIFLNREPARGLVPKVLDFGVAKVSQAHNITARGSTVGTPVFMSPEQATGCELGPASDVWSLGVILHLCLSGSLPFTGRDAFEVMDRIVHGSDVRLLEAYADLPPGVAAATDRALSRDPTVRYSDMRAFARSLLCTAVADGIVLPMESPDPVGLPHWMDWHYEEMTGPSTERRSPSEPPPSRSSERHVRFQPEGPQPTVSSAFRESWTSTMKNFG